MLGDEDEIVLTHAELASLDREGGELSAEGGPVAVLGAGGRARVDKHNVQRCALLWRAAPAQRGDGARVEKRPVGVSAVCRGALADDDVVGNAARGVDAQVEDKALVLAKDEAIEEAGLGRPGWRRC